MQASRTILQADLPSVLL